MGCCGQQRALLSFRREEARGCDENPCQTVWMDLAEVARRSGVEDVFSGHGRF